jgi:multifunctional methyltransferase subunit TRM112
MKILTANFLTCAVKACKSSSASFPLHFRDAELEQAETDYNPTFLINILPRIEWEALKVTATEVRPILATLSPLNEFINQRTSLEKI